MKQYLNGSASELNPVCELPASTCFSGDLTVCCLLRGVLTEELYIQISEVVQVNFFLPRNMFIPAINAHSLALKTILSIDYFK